MPYGAGGLHDHHPQPFKLIVFLQIHTLIQGGNLIGITVEHQRFLFEEVSDSTLSCLTPARMGNVWVDVGIEPIFTRDHDVPRGWRLFLGKRHADNGFDAFESILPGHHQAQRRAVLVW